MTMNTRNTLVATLLAVLPSLTQASNVAVESSSAPTVIGTQAVSASAITGNWTFSSSCLVFKDQAQESSLGSSAPVTKANTYLQKGLEKAGINAGKLTLTFCADGSLAINMDGRAINASYSVDGSNLTITGIGKAITTNISVNGNKLQLAMPADKVITLTQSISATATQASTTLSTVSGLLNSLNGTFVGLVFEK